MSRPTDAEVSKRQAAMIQALLEHPTLAKAAEAAGIPISTVMRWRTMPKFQAAYREARRSLTEEATVLLQKATKLAAVTLIEMMRDRKVAAAVRFSPRSPVLELAYKGEE